MAELKTSCNVASQVFIQGELLSNDEQKTECWTEVIRPQRHLLQLNLKELWNYRDLIWLFVRRDFVAQFKQTILGPLWFLLAPILTMLSFNFVFTQIAQISTDGVPGPLFYLAGITLWNYFQGCFSHISGTLNNNAGIFGKVYFPRLVAPISILISNLSKFLIQMALFLSVWIYYRYHGIISLNGYVLLCPLLVVIMGGIALGSGLIVSSVTTKYRDLLNLLSFGINLLMYVTPIAYPESAIPSAYRKYLVINPIAPIVESFRYGWTGAGNFSWLGLGYSAFFMSVILFVGLVAFNQTEKNFIDTV